MSCQILQFDFVIFCIGSLCMIHVTCSS